MKTLFFLIIAVVLAGCATAPPPIPEPVVVEKRVAPEFPLWVFEPFPVASGQTVESRGGTNLAQYHVLREQSAYVDACNVRLGRVKDIIDEFNQRSGTGSEPDEG